MASSDFRWDRLPVATRAALAGLAQDAAAAAWVATHGGEVLRWLHALGRAWGRGGFTIAVPQPEPLIKTLVQLDGDYVTVVCWKLIATLTVSERQSLLRQHRDALDAWLTGTAGTAVQLVRSARIVKLAICASPFGAAGSVYFEFLDWLPALAGALFPLLAAMLGRAALRRALLRAIKP